MPYLLIALAVTAVVVLLAWRGLGAAGEGQADRQGPSPRTKPRGSRPMAPDDDVEFLGEIDRKLRGEDKSG